MRLELLVVLGITALPMMLGAVGESERAELRTEMIGAYQSVVDGKVAADFTDVRLAPDVTLTVPRGPMARGRDNVISRMMGTAPFIHGARIDSYTIDLERESGAFAGVLEMKLPDGSELTLPFLDHVNFTKSASGYEVGAIRLYHDPQLTPRDEMVNRMAIERLHASNVAGQAEQVRRELYAAEFVKHDDGRDLDAEEDIRGSLRIRAAFPDLSSTVHQLVAKDDLVFVRHVISGTHSGEFPPGVAATGKVVSWERFVVYRLEDGKIVESWALPDRLGLARQLNQE